MQRQPLTIKSILGQLTDHLDEKIGDKREQEWYMTTSNPIPTAYFKLNDLHDLLKQGKIPNSTVLEAKMFSILLKLSEEFPDEMQEVIEYLQGICPSRYALKNIEKLSTYLKKTGKLDERAITELIKNKKEIQELEPLIHAEAQYPFTKVIPNDLPEGPFKTLINNVEDVYILDDDEEIKKLKDLLKQDNWFNDPFFKHRNFLFVALAACKRNIISPEQYTTLSLIVRLRKHYGEKNIPVYPLIENGEFTEQAQKKILPFLEKLGLKNKEQKEAYLNYIKNLPLFEQTYFDIIINQQNGPEEIKNLFNLEPFFLIRYGKPSSPYDEYSQYSFLSMGAYDRLAKVISPNGYVSPVCKFGSISRDDIEKSMRENKRIINVSYPHYKAGKRSKNPLFYHTWFARSGSAILIHDKYHELTLLNGCDVFLMSNESDIKLSDQNNLYLYKQDNQFFYVIIEQGKEKRYDIVDNEVCKILSNQGIFNQPKENPAPCLDEEICILVTEITSKINHTFSNKNLSLGFALVDILRDYFVPFNDKYKWTKSIWSLVDQEGSSEFREKYGLNKVCDMYSFILNNLPQFRNHEEFNLEFATVLYSMTFIQPDRLKIYDINPSLMWEKIRSESEESPNKYDFEEYLKEPYFSKTDPLQFNLLKLNLLFNTVERPSLEQVKEIFSELDTQKDHILPRITLRKDPESKNLLLRFDKKLLNLDLLSFREKELKNTEYKVSNYSK